jgi:hypothetical protein
MDEGDKAFPRKNTTRNRNGTWLGQQQLNCDRKVFSAPGGLLELWNRTDCAELAIRARN